MNHAVANKASQRPVSTSLRDSDICTPCAPPETRAIPQQINRYTALLQDLRTHLCNLEGRLGCISTLEAGCPSPERKLEETTHVTAQLAALNDNMEDAISRLLRITGQLDV